MFPQDYGDVVELVRQKRQTQATKFAEIPGQKDEYILRKAIEWPLGLYGALHAMLNHEEKTYLFGDTETKTKAKGLSWFIRKYPELSFEDDLRSKKTLV